MKNSAEYAKKLKKLYTAAKKTKEAADLVDSSGTLEPASLLVLAALSEFAPVNKAQAAFRKLKSTFVDFNELRVSRPREIVLAIGKNYPQGDKIADILIKVLNSVFQQHDGLEMTNLAELGKREAQAVIKEIDGITPYMQSVFLLYYLDSHSFPLNEHMLQVLKQEDIVNPKSDYHDVHGFLERQIPAAKGRELFVAIRDYCDNYELPETKESSTSESKKTAKKTVAKKAVTKKSVAKKTTVKKTVAPKTAAKKSTAKKTSAKPKIAKKKTTKNAKK